MRTSVVFLFPMNAKSFTDKQSSMFLKCNIPSGRGIQADITRSPVDIAEQLPDALIIGVFTVGQLGYLLGLMVVSELQLCLGFPTTIASIT